MPSQLVNESSTDATVGNQIRPPTTTTGIATMRATAIRSPFERRTARALRRAPPVLALDATSTAIAGPTIRASTREDGLLLLFDALDQAVDVVGLVQELLQRRDHDRRREVGPRVAVHVLRDVLRAGDQRRGLLLQGRVVRLARPLVRADDAVVDPEPRVGRRLASEVREQRLRALLVLRLARHEEAVDRRLDRVVAPLVVDRREREEVEVLRGLRVGELDPDERPEDVHAGLLVVEAGPALLPRPAQEPGLVLGNQLAPVVEDVLDPCVVTRLLAGHQPDVEVVAVRPHVDVVE